MLWYVATVDGEILFKERKIQYLNTVSKKTGNVATNKDIKSPFSGKPKCLKSHSKKTSQPRGEWNPTNRSVPKINKNSGKLAAGTLHLGKDLYERSKAAQQIKELKLKKARELKESALDKK